MALNLTPDTLQNKNVALTVNIAGQLYEVFARTSVNNVIVDTTNGTTLKERLQTLTEDIAVIKSSVGEGGSVDEKISAAVQKAVNEILDGASANYDTLKEIQAFIEAHRDELDSLDDLADGLRSDLDARVPDAKDAEVGAVLTHTADGNVWDKVLKVIDIDNAADLGTELAAKLKVGQIGVVVLEDEPAGYFLAEDGTMTDVSDMATFLTTSTDTGSVTLNDSVVLPKNSTVSFKGTINLNGYSLEEATE